MIGCTDAYCWGIYIFIESWEYGRFLDDLVCFVGSTDTKLQNGHSKIIYIIHFVPQEWTMWYSSLQSNYYHCSRPCSLLFVLFAYLYWNYKLIENYKRIFRNSYDISLFSAYFVSGWSKFSRDHTIGYKGRLQHNSRCMFAENLLWLPEHYNQTLYFSVCLCCVVLFIYLLLSLDAIM